MGPVAGADFPGDTGLRGVTCLSIAGIPLAGQGAHSPPTAGLNSRPWLLSFC